MLTLKPPDLTLKMQESPFLKANFISPTNKKTNEQQQTNKTA